MGKMGASKGLLEATTMHMSNNTLEKPMDDLRKKAKGKTNDDDGGGGSDDNDYERVSSASSTSAYRPSIVYPSYNVVSLGKGCRSSKEVSSSLSSSASSNVCIEGEIEDDDENELDADEEKTSRSSRQDFTPSRAEYKVTMRHDSSMNLSGPVTDL